MHKLKGDTLIEVALAIGVFSLIAITVVGVVSASLTNAQAALEVTLTREELDTQAEALRFIHEAYISSTQSVITSENDYEKLWHTITGYAKTPSTAAEQEKVKKYNPTTCSEIYNSDGSVKRLMTGLVPFVIDIRQLGNPTSSNISKIVLASGASGSANKFGPAATFAYPRILYTNSASLDEQAKYNNASYISKAEGIYIIAVAGKDNNVVMDPDNIKREGIISYYDFYIRSCWMPLNSDRASTISTVIRLYDPAAITY